jgi:hypothetical protein
MPNDPNPTLKSLAFKLTLLAIVALIAFSGLTILTRSLGALLPGVVIADHLARLLSASSITSDSDFFLFYLVLFLVGMQVALVFFLWNFRLFSGNPYIPIRSILLYIFTLAGTIYWHVKFFPEAFHYYAPLFVWRGLVLNAILFILTTGILISGMTKPRFATNLGFNFLLFVWLFYCAFPLYSPMGD